jgi:hypothetical protein
MSQRGSGAISCAARGTSHPAAAPSVPRPLASGVGAEGLDGNVAPRDVHVLGREQRPELGRSDARDGLADGP